ncbi:TPA: IgG-binding virulence factor TspB family protein, partial [Neisseria subflava]
MGNGVNAKVDDGFKKLINRSYTPHFEKYVSKQSVSAEIFHTSTGASSAARIGATVEATVSRKAVLSGAFGLVKAGAKLGLKAVPYVGAASYAYDAYQVVKSDLEFEGYKWNEVSEEFLKSWPARNCLTKEVNGRYINVACYGIDSSVVRLMGTRDKTKQKEVEYLMQAQMEKLAIPFWEKEKEERGNVTGGVQWTKYVLDSCHFDWNGGYCNVKSGNDYRRSVGFSLKMRDTEVLTQEKFLQISTQSIDANPTPFVEGTGKPEYQENIKVPAGTV